MNPELSDPAMAQLPQTVPECHACTARLMDRVKLLGDSRHKGHTRARLAENEVDRLVDCEPDAVCAIAVEKSC